MSEKETTKQAVEAFQNLSGDDIAKLKDLNTRIQNHKGKWGLRIGGEENANGSISERWVDNDPLIDEFVLGYMYEKGLTILNPWDGWDEGNRLLYESEDPTKYDNIDLPTALTLISVAVRKERAASGSLAWAFELGGFPKLINRLVELMRV